MQSLARNGYSADQVIAALHSDNRHLSFRYELLDNKNRIKKHLETIISGSVANNALAQIKRTARFVLKDDPDINYLTDRIKPYVRLRMPDGGWVEWPQGVFILSTPPERTDSRGIVTREIEAYDQLQVLVDDKVDNRYTLMEGTRYTDNIKVILESAGITQYNVARSESALPTTRDWDPGTSKLQIINDLLGAINYRSLFFDENGYAVALPYVSPVNRPSEYTYRNDQNSVIFPEAERHLDLFAIPNRWVIVVSNPELPPLRSTYTNTNPDSITSTVSRGRVIVDYREYDDIADQTALDARVQRIAFEASQVYEQVSFETAIMPMHSDSDVFTLQYTDLGISHKYSEVAWEMPLKAGERMKHRIRRIVNV